MCETFRAKTPRRNIRVVIYLLCVAAPMMLRSISLSSSGVHSLQASWEKPPGGVDSYVLALLRDRCVKHQAFRLVVGSSPCPESLSKTPSLAAAAAVIREALDQNVTWCQTGSV